jgi:preprotein translocase subunit SecE
MAYSERVTWAKAHPVWTTILIVLALVVALTVLSVVMLTAGEGSSPGGT